MLTDGALLERYARYGDADAFAELGNRYSGLVFSACFRITGNAEDAKDASQECFLELARNAGRIRSSLPSWLHKVARNKSSNIVRRACVSKQREEEAAVHNSSREESDWPEIASHIDEAIDRLPGSIRLTLILHYLQDKTQEEVARELGINQATVSRRLERGIDGMRRHLRKAGLTVPASVLAGLLAENSASAVPVALTAAIGKMAIAGIGSGGASAAGGVAVSMIAGISAFVGTAVGKTVAVTGAAAVLAGVGFGIHDKILPPRDALHSAHAVGVADSDQQMRYVIAAALEDQAAKLKGPFEIVYSSDSPGDNRWRPGVKRWRYVVTPETLFWELTMDERSMYQKSSLNRASGVFRSLVGSPEIIVREGLSFSRGYIARAYAGPMNSLFSNNLAWTERDFATAVRMGTVLPEQEAVDGFQCWRVVPVVATSPHAWTLWLDPKIGYSPRKIQWDHEDSTLAPVIWKLTDYREVSPEIWFPSVMHARGYDPEQKKIVEREYRREAVHLDKTYSADELEIVFPSESEVEDTIRDMIYTKP